MKKTLRNGKVFIACVTAFAILAVSLLSVFTGAGITTLAASVSSTDQWNGEFDTTLSGGGTESDPYLITSAEELAAVCYGKATGATTGAYFKVSGVDEFYMDSITAPATVKAFESATAVFNHYNAIATAPVIWKPNTSVNLKFDGSGAVVYGLYMVDVPYSGLFATAKGNTVIENIAVKNSYIYDSLKRGTTEDYCGFILGIASWTKTDTVNIKNCIVTNNYAYSISGNFGEIIGHCAASAVTIDSCLAADNELYYSATVQKGPYQYFGRAGDNGNDTVKNCIGIDVVPQIRATGTYTNNYYYGSVDHSSPDITSGVTELTSADLAKGTAAATNMSGLDKSNWFFNTTTYPEPVIFHDLRLADNGDGTHSYNCDCGLKGIPSSHTLVNKACECGYAIKCGDGIVETWDGKDENGKWIGWTYGTFEGSGTSEDPYIIKYSEQLGYLATANAASYSVTVGKYYKVDDSIKAFNMNTTGLDLSGDMTAAEVKSALENEVVNRAYWTGSVFAGTFDGNGVIIYGVHTGELTHSSGQSGAQIAGLFPNVAAGAVIKNLTLKNSYFYTSNSLCGGLIGNVTADAANAGSAADTVCIENVVVHDCYIGCTNNGESYPGVILGNAGSNAYVNIKNCLVYGNDVLNTYNGVKSIVGYVEKNANSTTLNRVTNSIVLGVTPYSAKGNWWFKACDHSIFQNVYFDNTTDTSGFGNYGHANSKLTQLSSADDAKGAAATNMTDLDLSVWFFDDTTYPQLRALHDTELKIEYADDEYAGHTETCSCGAGGVTVTHSYNDAYTCTVCGFICDHQSADHYTYNETDGADHVTAGTYTKTCECGYTDSGSLNDATEHIFEDIAEVPSADCQTHGVAAHKYCSLCDKNYATDATATEPIANALSDEALQLAVAGHTPTLENGEIVYDMSETQHAKLCAVCDEPYDYEYHNGDFVPNGAEGHTGECTVCGLEVSDKAGHNFGDDNVCDDCEWICENHNFIDDNVIEEGDCATDRVVATKCSICGTAGENNVTTAIGHNFIEDEGYEADCINAGLIAHKWCDVCDKNFAADEEDVLSKDYIADNDLIIPANTEAHTWEDVAEEKATCEEPGCIEHKICTVCLLVIAGEEEIQLDIDYEAINPGNFETEEEWLAAVEAAVYSAYEEAGIIVEAKGHDLEAVAEVAATTEAEGVKAHYACKECDTLFEDENGEKETTAEKLVIEKLAADNKEDQEDTKTDTDDGKENAATDTKQDNTANTDNSAESPKTGESAAVLAIVLIMTSAVLALFKKLRTA